MRYVYIIIVLAFLISCKDIKKEDYGSFNDQFTFITGSDNALKLNVYAESYDSLASFKFVYFVDGGCDLCSLDLSEVENLRKSIFLDYGITPLAILYGNVNNYTLRLIKQKSIYNYPIYNLNYNDYDSLMMNFSLNINALLVSGDGDKIFYMGSPLSEKNDMNNLLNVLNEI